MEMGRKLRSLILIPLLLLGACAHAPADEPHDPLEVVNRPIYKFNMTADKYVLRPVAKGYAAAVPAEIRGGIGNFFDNLFYPTTIINDFLQGKFVQGGQDVGRFLMNSTIGLVGFLDVASQVGLHRNDEDFGQTLGRWGFGEGWYLMLPLLGPSSNRDLVGFGADYFTGVTYYIDNDHVTIPLTAVNLVDKRAQLLNADSVLEQQFDPYLFVRTAYLQRRQSQVYDGNPPQEKYDFEE